MGGWRRLNSLLVELVCVEDLLGFKLYVEVVEVVRFGRGMFCILLKVYCEVGWRYWKCEC